MAEAEAIFLYTYPGVDDGYLCTNETSKIVTKEWIYGMNCEVVKGFDAIDVNSFKGSMLCGVRGGEPFVSAIRPSPLNHTCPEGTVPCSKNTKPEKTICYPPDQVETKCPLIEIRFSYAHEPKG